MRMLQLMFEKIWKDGTSDKSICDMTGMEKIEEFFLEKAGIAMVSGIRMNRKDKEL